MKYAIPVCEGKLFNHYSKAPQFLILDDTTHQRVLLDIEDQPNTETCGKKSKIMSLLKDNQINAVIIKNIGEAMLTSLFNQGIKVFTIIRGTDIDHLDFNQLVPIEDINFAKPSMNKRNKGHNCCKSKCEHNESGLSLMKYRPESRTLEKLQRIRKIHN